MNLRVLVQPRPNFFQDRGGDNVQLEKSVEHLRALGVQADISVDPHADLASYDLVEIYNFAEGCNPLPYLVNARRQNKPVVLMPIYWDLSRFHRAQAALETNVPPPESAESLALHARMDALRRAAEQMCRALVLAQCELILPNSNAEGQLLARDYGASPEKIRVVYNGAEPFFRDADPTGFVQQHGLNDFVLCVARVAPQKNQLGLVQAWHDETTPLVLIGDDTSEPDYAALVRAAAGPNTLFLPHMPHELLAGAYAAAHVHALPSWYEMMPLAALEAGVAGCNLVLTTETAGPEFFGDKVWYCEPDDPDSIRQAIRSALAAPRQAVLADYIRANFSWEHTAQQLSRAYHEAVEHHAARVPENLVVEPYTTALEALALTLDALARDTTQLAADTWQHSLELTKQLQALERVTMVSGLRRLKKQLTVPQ